MGLDELTDIGFQDLVAHAKATAGIEAFLVQEKATGALQIALRPGGLGQDVNSGRYGGCHDKILKLALAFAPSTSQLSFSYQSTSPYAAFDKTSMASPRKTFSPEQTSGC
jgi:hypothetical protein